MNEWDEDRKVIEAATPGPWHNEEGWSVVHQTDGPWMQLADMRRSHRPGNNERQDQDEQEANAEFTALARTRWPVALDRIEELEGRLAALKRENEALAEALLEHEGQALPPAIPER